jgi:hypothetical protein
VPSNIPVSGFAGKSLFGLFTSSIGAEMVRTAQPCARTLSAAQRQGRCAIAY